MLYKFKSEAGGDVIMLEASGRQVLQIIGKDADGKGILLPEQMDAALAALQQAIAAEEALGRQADAQAPDASAADASKPAPISLRKRAWPLISLMEQSARAKAPITWGV